MSTNPEPSVASIIVNDVAMLGSSIAFGLSPCIGGALVTEYRDWSRTNGHCPTSFFRSRPQFIALSLLLVPAAWFGYKLFDTATEDRFFAARSK